MVAKLFAAVVLVLSAQVTWAQNTHPSKSAAEDEGRATGVAAATPSVIGTWKAPTERLPLSGEFNEKVWGKNAVSVRDVTLTIKATGEGVLTVSRKVLDGRSRVVPGSASVEQAEVAIGSAKPGFATRLDHAVKVINAERTYPDAPGDRWPMDRLRVDVVSFTDGDDTLEVRFEPADGKGAFSELLKRQRVASRHARR